MWLAAIRDVAIVVLAIESVIIGILLALTLVQIRRLVRMLREEIAPMLDSASDTINTMQGTANIVGQTVVHPLIEVSSYSAGALQTLRSLLFIRGKTRERSTSGGRSGGSPDNS